MSDRHICSARETVLYMIDQLQDRLGETTCLHETYCPRSRSSRKSVYFDVTWVRLMPSEADSKRDKTNTSSMVEATQTDRQTECLKATVLGKVPFVFIDSFLSPLSFPDCLYVMSPRDVWKTERVGQLTMSPQFLRNVLEKRTGEDKSG